MTIADTGGRPPQVALGRGSVQVPEGPEMGLPETPALASAVGATETPGRPQGRHVKACAPSWGGCATVEPNAYLAYSSSRRLCLQR